MICPRCHRALRPNAKFCPYCGAKVSGGSPQQIRTPQPTQRAGWAVRKPSQQVQIPPRQPIQRGGWQQPVRRESPQQGQRLPPQNVQRRWQPSPQKDTQKSQSREWEQQDQSADPNSQLGLNYKAIILKSFVERKLKDDKIDKTDFNEIERRFAEYLEAKGKGLIPDEKDIALLEFRFRQLLIMALRELTDSSILNDEETKILAEFEKLSLMVESVADVTADAIKLPGEFELIVRHIAAFEESLLDLRLLENQSPEYNLTDRNLSKLHRIMVNFHRTLQAFVTRVNEVCADLSISVHPKFQILDEIDNFVQNQLLIETVQPNLALEVIQKFESTKSDLEKFMDNLQKVAIEADIETLQLQIMQNSRNLALLEQCLEIMRNAYGKQKRKKQRDLDKEYTPSIKKIESSSMVEQSALEKTKEETDTLSVLDPLPPLDELPELDPLQPFS